MILNFLFFIFIKLKALYEKKIPTTKPKWDKDSYDKQNIDMGIAMFVQTPNSATLSKK